MRRSLRHSRLASRPAGAQQPRRRTSRCFELYATGDYALDDVRRITIQSGLLNRRGKPLARSQYHRMLSNPTYYGVIQYCDEVSEGTHLPIVSKALFDEVQAVIAGVRKPRGKDKLKPFLYRGVFRCGERGRLVTTELQKGNHYLHCTKRVKRDCSPAVHA